MSNNRIKINYNNNFENKLLAWHKKYGRKNLPWQVNMTAYRIWISEIMLQQTQVGTVIGYFERFMQSFPDIQALANAKEDEVLHLWTGLGYYARARNLHKAAKILVNQYAGKFPSTQEALEKLPGIGRSTAGAILSFAFKKRAPILDGNVKRVLSRFHAVLAWKNEDSLWQLAEKHTPYEDVEKYTQAIMDLGAMICTRTKPQCGQCPVQKHCEAYQTQQQSVFPGKRPRKILPVRKICLLILKNAHNKILLEKRPSSGIWGGLWSLPEFKDQQDIFNKYGNHIDSLKKLNPVRHTFTHFHLDIYPVEAKINHAITGCWYDLKKPSKIGLAAPIKKLIMQDLTVSD